MNTPLPEPRTVVLLGVPFHDVTLPETLGHMDAMIARRTPGYLATANLDFAAQASRDVELQRILLDADLVLCDGTPLVWASRWLGAPLRERVAGSDLMPHLFQHAAQHGHRLFFLGSTDEVLAVAKQKCEEQYPGLNICGMLAPPFAKLLDMDHAPVLRAIREAAPDILLVAMGCPKQEKWIYMHHRATGVPVSIGIGASLDFVAGLFRRAPVWMRVCGLEWVFRLMQEPRRLFHRYWFDLVFFVARLRRERRLLAPRLAPSPTPPPAPPGKLFAGVTCVTWSGRIDAAGVHEQRVPEPCPAGDGADVVLDASGVTFVDSTGLGLLLRGFRRCKSAGGTLVLYRPAESLVTLLGLMRLDRFLPAVHDSDELRRRLRTGSPAGAVSVVHPEDGSLGLTLSGEITAATVPAWEAFLRAEWRLAPEARGLVLDLRDVSFVDSSGLGLLLKARKLAAERPCAAFTVRRPTDNVLNVIRTARLAGPLGLDPAP